MNMSILLEQGGTRLSWIAECSAWWSDWIETRMHHSLMFSRGAMAMEPCRTWRSHSSRLLMQHMLHVGQCLCKTGLLTSRWASELETYCSCIDWRWFNSVKRFVVRPLISRSVQCWSVHFTLYIKQIYIKNMKNSNHYSKLN